MTGYTAILAVGLALTCACERPQASTPDAGPPASASASAVGIPAESTPTDAAGATPVHSEGALTHMLHLPCRAIAVDGVAEVETEGGGTDGSAPNRLAQGSDIPVGVWLSLARGSRVVAKDPRTTRETTFLGHARVRACVGHREESWLASGTFESSVGAGETPGAEEWVVTPLGVVRYLAAKVRVEVRPTETFVSVASGDAFLRLSDDVRAAAVARAGDAGRRSEGDAGEPLSKVDEEGWFRVTEGDAKLSGGGPPGTRTRTAVDRCTDLTTRSRELAGHLFGGGILSDGGAAKEQLMTRRLARAACAVASMMVAALDPSPARDALGAALNAGSLDR